MGPLDGIRVIDFGQYIAGPLTAMMLADQGADVIHVDPPGGPRWQSPANGTLNRGKQRLVLDLKNEEDRDYARSLVAGADVVIENFRPGVMDRLGFGPRAITAANAQLVYCSLPGFASDNPRASLSGWEGVIAAATGTYWGGRRGQDAPPNFTAITISSCFAALSAAVSVVMALLARERDGLGQAIEVPLFDATFLAIGANGVLVDGKPEGGRPDDPWTGNFEAADGRFVRLNLASPKFIRNFTEAVGKKEWEDRGYVTWPSPLKRGSAEWDDQQRELVEIMKSRTAEEWEAFGREADIPLTMVRKASEWIETDQARKAAIVTELDDPELGPMLQPASAVRIYGLTEGTFSPRPEVEAKRDELVPRRGGWTSSGKGGRLSRVLEGMLVIDLTQVLAGPTAARTLAEFGAEVVKINNPWEQGAGYRWNVHRYHTDVNRGKETILLDIKTPEGREVFWALAEKADVVLQNFRRGVAERLGIGYEQARDRQPNVVYGSISFYGYDGPWEMTPGFEPNAQASTGLAARQQGFMPFAVNDYATGMLGAYALALGLFHRERTGQGTHITTSLAAAGTFLQVPYVNSYEGKKWDEPAGPYALGWSPLQRLFEAADGWLFLGAAPSSIDKLAALDGLAGIDILDGASLAVALERGIALKTVAEWEMLFASAGAAAKRVVPSLPLMADPWVIEHGLSVTRVHKGGDTITTTGPPARLSRTPVVTGRPASRPGADALEVLTRVGLEDRLDDYVRRKIIVLE